MPTAAGAAASAREQHVETQKGWWNSISQRHLPLARESFPGGERQDDAQDGEC